MYFIKTKPPIKKIVKLRAKRLKYLFIKLLILGPNFQINQAIRKNRAPRLTIEASANIPKLILKAPAVIVNTL